MINRISGSIIGGIVGDSYGSPYEFKKRGTYIPSINMEKNDNFNLPAGSFTDDSSMMLCLAASLAEKNTFDPIDQMRKYTAWREEGYMSVDPSKGCFDIGATTSRAIARFMFSEMMKERNPNENLHTKVSYGLDNDSDSGNGGIMRLAPVPAKYWRDISKAVEYSKLSSKVTHASKEALDCAAIMGWVIANLIGGKEKLHILYPPKEVITRNNLVTMFSCGEYLAKSKDNIKTTGYCVHSLEAAMWAFANSSTFEQGMILLAGMGGDVDTICCIYGQIAGSYYGFEAIPERWKNKLQQQQLIKQTVMKLIKTIME